MTRTILLIGAPVRQWQDPPGLALKWAPCLRATAGLSRGR